MMNKKEVAELLSVSVPSVDRYMKKGLPYVKFSGVVRFELQNVMEWVRSNKWKK